MTVDTVLAPDPRWLLCESCRQPIYEKRWARALRVCPVCGAYARLSAAERIEQLADPGSVRPIDVPAVAEDPLEFTDTKPYTERLRTAREATGLRDAVVCVRATIGGHPVVAAVMDFRFLGGSLGCAAGEHLVAAAGEALRERVPFLVVTASGGARMQEGALSLMQMAKVTQAICDLDRAGILTVAVLTDPTYGGVAASFATQTDIILAERGAHVGFAGPRVIAQTIREDLPADFQTAEFLVERGLVDEVVPRHELRGALGRILAVASPGRPLPRPRRVGPAPLITRAELLPERDPWEVVRLARDIGRPTTLDYCGLLLEGFVELHGDRVTGDCPAIVAGLGRFRGRPVMVIGQQKGHDAAELKARNYAMPAPAGYRKAGRLMRLADKLGIPVVTLVDTPGAHPGVEAERDGQAWSIADNLRIMAGLTVPVVAVVTGEGGSGGALALACADRVYVMENSVYSVISPEGCASILWKSAAAGPLAARSLRVDPRALLGQGVADGVVREPEGGAQHDHAAAAELLAEALGAALDELSRLGPERRRRERAERFRAFGTVAASEDEGGAA